ncbi:hypothetical protein NEIELOOT_00495 [Neisseria elongata subsp. glycolytica ATCC 29315]|uniref:Uncharacterized protein n=1 Tax=Neisseria elongata subsp. glycolytica ATCC 29315 TaxID=546263 RepID=D4DN71_NEIEG|nr:hypothetical protein NEIELOOT_00495 [Neisseria elongata subsp. glycolytica ATCC 29315]
MARPSGKRHDRIQSGRRYHVNIRHVGFSQGNTTLNLRSGGRLKADFQAVFHLRLLLDNG